MAGKSGQRMMYIGAFALLAVGLAGLMISGVSRDSVYFLNVSEALAKGLDNLDKARLFGKVKENGLEHRKDTVGVSFLLADTENPDQAIRVAYQGAVPDTFRPGVEVIVEGRSHSTASSFTAHTLMTKCPSKYENE
ncbi:cytochrome c maturation protein CcmE [Desulfovermiculus halophilus]|jgi:cytochrome c-type biogenesis protein CcmE|uniref:cytochrome c maturation protein CcmE n=1 Tax=Desulfovermiculus halophilus TaxID=339722 RepID=UPI000488677A|nr:cytochrome c maturation protein CcmE [Desulfovermiculus halophilus]